MSESASISWTVGSSDGCGPIAPSDGVTQHGRNIPPNGCARSSSWSASSYSYLRFGSRKLFHESRIRENCTSGLCGGRRQALHWAPPPTRQRRRFCNGAGAKGLCCSAEATGQLVTGGARGQGKAVRHPEAGGVGSLQEGEGQPGGGWSRRTVDCGLRGRSFEQPLQALQSAIVRELFSSAG